jgi:hypothetical protein
MTIKAPLLGRAIRIDEVRARDGDGLKLYEDGGAGIFVKDGGDIGIGTTAPETLLQIGDYSSVNHITLASQNAQAIGSGLKFSEIADFASGFFMYQDTSANILKIEGWQSSAKLTDIMAFTRDTCSVGIGTVTPANPLAVNRSADGTIVDFESADTVEGSISIAGNTTSYNAFMGSHYTQLKDGQKTPPVGAIVVATGEIIACESHIELLDTKAKKTKGKSGVKVITRDVSGVERKEYFSYIELASQGADKRVYGVYHAKLSDDSRGQSFGEDNKPVHQIASVGLYKVRVTDTNGDITGGDYIQSSIRLGEGEKQDDDVLHNYTVAKAIIDVDWDAVAVDQELGYKWKLIPATLHCG